MKRIRLWLRELSLTQQLITIIFLFVILFSIFLFVFLAPSIDQFSETELFRILHNSQESLIYSIENHPQEALTYDQDTSILQAVYDPDAQSFEMIQGSHIHDAMKNDVIENGIERPAGRQDFKIRIPSSEDRDEQITLYSMTQLKNGKYLISILTGAYRNQFRTSLINGVVNMNIFFVSILFVLLMLWVGTLIIPLNQIKSYANKIKNDEPASLNIKRRDEIGEVADALQEMEYELSKQSREKEEMIQNISHDLKTPIATIKSYGESIKDGIYPYETLEKSVDVIVEHADRLEKKVHSLIILNKMGYLLDNCPEGDHLEMAKVIDKVLLSLRVIRPEVTFETDIDPDVLFHGEEEPWRIAVENIIDNALRYAKSYINIVLKDGELTIANDGSHISEEHLEKLFKPYEKGSDGQFGLGLSIVYKVCTTYGYRISAENLQDGVRFRIAKQSSKKERKKPKKK